MAFPLKIVCLILLLPIVISTVERATGDHREFKSGRLFWPVWLNEKLPSRAHHDRHGRSFQQNIGNGWKRNDLFSERPNPTVAPPQTGVSRHHVEQRIHEQRTSKPEKFSAAAVAEYGGTRTIAYAGYHNNHRHQPREAVTQVYQHISSTPATYARHHPGVLNILHFPPESSPVFLCCPGWTQSTHLTFGCNKPTCPSPCLNGGVCTTPGRCTCPKGFTGNQCQTDIDECVTEKPCDQFCRNLPGTYECHCRSGFQLQKDGQSCRKNDTEDTAFEARDLENDFPKVTTIRPSVVPHDTENEVAEGNPDQDYEIILKRLTKLEKQFAKGRKRETDTSEMNVKVASVVESINEMKRAVENVQLMQQEIYEMRRKLREYELESRKMQHLTNRVVELENRFRLRCRSAIPMNSGSLNF